MTCTRLGVLLLIVSCAHVAPVDDDRAFLTAHQIPPRWMEEALDANRSSLVACLSGGASVSGHFLLGASIDADGKVTHASLIGPAIGDAAHGCVTTAIEAWRFPATGTGEGAQSSIALIIDGTQRTVAVDRGVPAPRPAGPPPTEAEKKKALARAGPPPPAPPPGEGGLPDEVVRATVRAHQREISACIDIIGGRDALAISSITLTFIIEADGSVARALVDAGVVPRLERCILQHLLRWRFPPPVGGGIVPIRYELLLDAGQI